MENRYVDWSKAFESGEWECLGRQIMEERKGCWSEDNPEGLENDDYVPIYNYAYPLDLRSLDEDKIVKICDETNCTVVLNCEDDLLYLALVCFQEPNQHQSKTYRGSLADMLWATVIATQLIVCCKQEEPGNYQR